jgi:hypothetical protein
MTCFGDRGERDKRKSCSACKGGGEGEERSKKDWRDAEVESRSPTRFLCFEDSLAAKEKEKEKERIGIKPTPGN